jgi:hypothetical protein
MHTEVHPLFNTIPDRWAQSVLPQNANVANKRIEKVTGGFDCFTAGYHQMD